MEMDQKTNLGTGSIGKLLFQLAVPAITAQVINALYNVVDRMYIGHIPKIGATALTGVGVTFPIIMIISAFAALISMGGAPRAAIMMGKKENEAAEQVLGNCTTALIFTSILLTGLFFVFGDKLLMLFGASKNTFSYAKAYMTIYALGTIFVQLALGLNAFITTQGFAKTSMLTVLIGAVTNIILDPIFIFGFNMDVRGAALATIISQAISAVWVIHFLSGKKTILKIRRQHLKIAPRVLFPVLSLGLAPFIMQSTESLIILCFNSSLLKYGGDLAVGAMTILSSVMQFVMLPLSGLTQGAQPIVSFNYGAGNPERVKGAFRLLLISCVTYSVAMWLLVMIAPRLLAMVFTDDTALIEKTAWALRIYMGAGFMLGAQIACQQTFIALGNAKTSTFLALLRKILLLIPLIFLLPLFMEDKVLAVFLAEPIADFIAVAVTIILFTISFKKLLKRMREQKQSTSSL